ncbi:MAG: hypothetical protein O4965_03335, partial [Trichodesmium sp. St19_bin1]|nr:hypothetical protein [Trichodesmium sp. St19_bin1]
MPKSNQRQNKKKSQPDARELKPIKIDETIVSGKTSKMNGGENLSITVPLDDFLQQIDSFQIVEDDD